MVLGRGAGGFICGLIINREPGVQQKNVGFCYLRCTDQVHLFLSEKLDL